MNRLHYLTSIKRLNCIEVVPLADVVDEWNKQHEHDDSDRRLGTVVFFIALTAGLVLLAWIGWVLVE